MSSYTLTFGSNVTVTVNGTNVTSPYTLASNATIVVTRASGTHTVNINATEYYGDITSVALSDTDITITEGEGKSTNAISITINYTIS